MTEHGAAPVSGSPSGRRVYLDHNASSPLRPAAREAMIAAFEVAGNPSSVHAHGRAARALMEKARAEIAAVAGADPRGIVFTSGATEAIALALNPEVELAGRAKSCGVLLASAVEHPAVMKGHCFSSRYAIAVDVDGDGRIDLAALDASLKRHTAGGRRAMVALQLANNETGVVQPILEAARLARTYDGVVFCDAVQGAGRLALDLIAPHVDFMAVSAHKLGGPQGIGALIATHPDSRVPPLVPGGGQERGRRGGTENVAAIAGFGAAVSAARAVRAAEQMRIKELRDQFEREVLLRIPGVRVIAAKADRLANTSLIAFQGVRAETLVIALDLANLSVSAGAACSSGKVGASHVLAAMAVEPEWAGGAIRFSLGWSSTREDMEFAVDTLQRVVPQVRSRSTRAA